MAARELRTLAIGLVLGLACLGAYANVLANDFVSFDDPKYVLDNPQVRLGLSAEGVHWAFTHAYSDNWHPLTWISHMLDVEWFGLDPRGHHAVGAALHAINAVLLFALLLRTSGRRWPSALCAALFALHPLRVESVVWAAERKDVLSAFFFLLTLIAYVRFCDRPTVRRYVPVAVLFSLGLLAKPMLVTLPVLLLLLDRWPLGRSPSLIPPARLFVEKIPLFALALLSGLVTLWAQSLGGTMKSLELVSLVDRVQNAAVAVVVYLQQILWPFDLAFFYPHPALVEGDAVLAFPARALLCTGVIAVITWAALRTAASVPVFAVGWLWFLVGLAPVIGLVQVGAQAHADRYTYLPSIGLTVAAVFGLHEIKRRLSAGARERRRAIDRTVAVLALALLTALVLGTNRQVAIWRSSERLYQHALEVTSHNYIAAFNLGALASAQGAHATAIEFYRMALEMRPTYAAAHSNLGVALDHLGHADQAVGHYREALALDPRLTQAAINLGGQHALRGEHEIARGHYRAAIDARPDLALPLEVLGELEQRLGNLKAATSHFEDALAIEPGSTSLRAKLASALSANRDEAAAIRHYRIALEQQPDFLAALNALARLLATATPPSLRDGAEALQLAKRASRATGERNPTFLMTLSLAHLQAGHLEEAAQQRDRAIAFSPASDRAALAAEYEHHASSRNAREAGPP